NLNDSSRVTGATTDTLSISNISQGDAASYSVRITNSYGAITSSIATLTVNDPVIAQQPLTQVLPTGTNAVFQVTAFGLAPLSYQWFKDGVALSNGGKMSGATSAVLTISNISAGDIGAYWVRVMNGASATLLSAQANLYLSDPAIT